MPFASPRGWPKTPLIAFGVAAGCEVARLALHRPPGVIGAVLEGVAVAALALALGTALHAALEARRGLAKAQDAARALAARAEALAEVIDGAGEAILVIDDQATIVTFNRAAERMFGYKAAELIGSSLERLMTAGAAKAHAAYLAQTGVTAMVEAARLRTVHRGVRKRGEVFPFELVASEWSDAGRRMFTGVIRDVTERERTADDVREAEAGFAELFEAVDQPLFIFSVAGDGGFGLDSMNRAAEAITGLSRFAVAGWTPDQLARTQARPLKRAMLEAVSAGASATAEVPFEVAGAARTATVVVTPMRNGAGEIRRVLIRVSVQAAGGPPAP
jgi:PAS domain S-box-containing protein